LVSRHLRSDSFEDYAKCVLDAIQNGFNPNEHGYSTEMNGRKTCYRLNEPPETLER